MSELREQIAKAKAVKVLPELQLEGSYAGGKLIGFADIVVRKKAGELALLDMKWAGQKKYSDKLRKSRHLQLALYAELLRQKEGAWPSVAYFILHDALLCAADDHYFPGARVIGADSGEGTAQLWARFVKTWKWRKAQVEKRVFEVALETIEAPDDEAPPADALELEYLNPTYNEYLNLAGWDE